MYFVGTGGERGRNARPKDEANLRKQMSNNTLEYESCLDYVLPFPLVVLRRGGLSRRVCVCFFSQIRFANWAVNCGA